jgi:cysteine-rich repeat protein
VVTILLVSPLHGCGDGHRSTNAEPRTPTAADAAFGFIGNVLVAERPAHPGDPAHRMWIGFSSRDAFRTVLARQDRLLAGDIIGIIGTIVPSHRHRFGFYFDPETTRLVSGVTADEAASIDGLHDLLAKGTPAKSLLPRLRVQVKTVVETPAVCGDGFVQVGEECDALGPPCNPLSDLTSAPRACASDCTCPPSCGDGVVDTVFEQCDDGNEVDGDGCSRCQLDPVTVNRDLATGFREFEFRVEPGLGFCPGPKGSLRFIFISRDPQNRFQLSASLSGDTATCGDPSLFDDCPPAIGLPTRILTPDEVSTVLDAFSRVAVTENSGPSCGFDDPCLVREFRWTNATDQGDVTFSVDDQACAPRLLPNEAERLLGALRALLPDS